MLLAPAALGSNLDAPESRIFECGTARNKSVALKWERRQINPLLPKKNSEKVTLGQRHISICVGSSQQKSCSCQPGLEPTTSIHHLTATKQTSIEEFEPFLFLFTRLRSAS